jgi:hypothetical protein
MKRVRNGLLGVIVGAVVAIGGSAFAQQSFTVNPGAVGEPQGSFEATFIDFSYVALVDQTAVGGSGTFTEEGGGFFSSFRHPDLNTAVVGSGINETYKLYLLFDAAGTVEPNPSGGLDVTFTDFNATIWVDTAANTQITADGTGAPDGTVSASNTGDDIQVGHSIGLLTGEAHIFPSLAAGDFNVLIFFEPDGGFFSGPVFIGLTIGDVNGVNTTITGVDGGSFTDGRIDGSGNVSFVAVPEPSSLLLLGFALVALSTFARRKGNQGSK